MSEQIFEILKRKNDDLALDGLIDPETRFNIFKEVLQYYILHFVYHHPAYNTWVMYGGSALRIIHGLDRMSVDLDFEVSHAVTDAFVEELKKEIENHFVNTYGTGADALTVKLTSGRGLILKFRLDEELSAGHASKQVHVKIDLNHFVASKTVLERRPINRDQLSFVIITYNMGALMASKIAAIFLRGTRGVGEAIYGEKGRDIYDLLWYMNKKVVPDFDYLTAKNVSEAKDLRTLFGKLTIKMNTVSKENLKYDLLPLFVDRTYIENWLDNWHESYLRLLDEYKIRTVEGLKRIEVYQDFRTDNFSFLYRYNTEDGGSVKIIYIMSDYWIDFREGNLSLEIDRNLEDKIDFSSSGVSGHPAPQDKLKAYATLFYKKSEDYFKKTKRVMLGDSIVTKVIRMTADNVNQKEQIVLTMSAMLSSELDDLLK